MKKILIVVDVQNDFVTGALANPEAQKAMPAVVELIKNFDGKVIYTQDTHDVNYAKSLEGQMLPVPHCIKWSEGWELCPEIKELSHINHNEVFEKPTFGSLNLVHYLQSYCADEPEVEFHFCGFCTDICVISNVLMVRAAFPNMHIFCHANACAGVTPEKHAAALEVMRSCQIEVV